MFFSAGAHEFSQEIVYCLSLSFFSEKKALEVKMAASQEKVQKASIELLFFSSDMRS